MALNEQLRNDFKSLIEKSIELESRANQNKPTRYWYPLSLATYGSEEILEALDSMCSFRTSMWEKTLEFERRFSSYLDCFDSVMVNSGSSADLLMAFLLTNPRSPILKPGDEILIPIVTWPTHVWSAMMAGLKVKFVDVDPDTLNIDLLDLKKKISKNTKAIFLVHLLGNPCEMDQIKKMADDCGAVILEDCCEAMGAEYDGKKVGTFGIAGSFSFFFSHHITTMEGGIISCNQPEIVDDLRILRAHGWTRNSSRTFSEIDESKIDSRYAFVNWGFNVRPTDVNAAFGLEQLRKLPKFNMRREEIYNKFKKEIESLELPIKFPKVSKKSTPSWLAIPMMIESSNPESRHRFCEYLEINGVETRPIVAGNLAKHPVAKLFKEFNESTFPGADIIHSNGLYIGLSPMITDTALDRLIDVIKKYSW